MEEIWKPIVVWKNKIKYDFSDFYEISNFGNVRSIDRTDANNHQRKSQIIKQTNHKNLYYRVGLRNGDKQSIFFVHRLVWEAFYGKIPDGMVINHLDENGHNNRLDNLSVCDAKTNNIYGTRLNRVSKANINNPKISKPIIQYDLEGNFIKEWPSMSEVKRQLSFDQSNISACCLNKFKQAYGYIWKFKEKAA